MTVPAAPPETPARPKKQRRWPWVASAAVVFVTGLAIAGGAQDAKQGVTAAVGPATTAVAAGQQAGGQQAGTATAGAVRAPAQNAAPAPAPAAPAQAAAPADPPAPPPSVFTGRGDDVVAIHRPAGVKVVRFSCPRCSGNTVVKTDGEEFLLVNTIGAYSGQQWADVHDGSTTSTITITATGAWTLTVGGLDLARHAAGPVSGRGDDVIALTGGTTAAAITNRGSSNFVVQTVSDAGTDIPVNEIGGYTGTVPLPAPALVQVTSDGTWSITPR